MATVLRIGQDISSRLSRLIEQTLEHKCVRHTATGPDRMVEPRTTDLSPPRDWRHPVEGPLGVGHPFGVLTKEKEWAGKNVLRCRNSSGVVGGLGNHFRSTSKNERSPKVFKTHPIISENSEGSQLIVDVLKAFGK